jgi:lambda family phage portal protein
MVGYLKPGEDVRFSSPPSDSGGQFETQMLHAIAAGIGVTYEQLTGDLSRVNYSSYRAGLIDFRGLVEEDRWNMYVPMLCAPVWERVMRTAYLAALTRSSKRPRAEWVASAAPSVDPVKDAEALEKELRLLVKTIPQAIAERGYNPDEQLRQVAETNAKLDELGIVTDADPRKTGKTLTEAKTSASDKPAGDAKPAKKTSKEDDNAQG